MPLLPAAATTTADGALDAIGDFLGAGFAVGGVTITVGSVLAAVVVLLLAVLVSRLLRGGLNRYAKRHDTSQSALYTLTRLMHYVVLAVGVLLALSAAGIPLNKFALFAGAVGVGLGFGLQAIFSNFISGLIILFDRSLKVGDFVEVADDVHGEVRDIHIRATRITTNDNIDILVPNSKFITDNVVNLTWRDVCRRSHIAFRVPYGADKEIVRKAALEAAAEVPFTLTEDAARKPQVWLTGFGESAMEFALVVWLNASAAKRYSVITAAYNWALHNALEKYHLELPFPQRDLHVKSWLGLAGGEARGDLREQIHGSGSAVVRPERGTQPSELPFAPAENDAARSVTRDIARDEAAPRNPEDAETGIRERAASDRANAEPASPNDTVRKGSQAHGQDD